MIKVNGRSRFYRRLENFRKVSSDGVWSVERNGVPYTIQGGKRAGGTRKDWFIDGGTFKSFKAAGLVDALNILDGM